MILHIKLLRDIKVWGIGIAGGKKLTVGGGYAPFLAVDLGPCTLLIVKGVELEGISTID